MIDMETKRHESTKQYGSCICMKCVLGLDIGIMKVYHGVSAYLGIQNNTSSMGF
jgi:hypothetical protein